jgi:phage shock protein A
MSDNILGRIANLVRANVNSLIDGAEDPDKMLDQLVRDYTNNIAEAEQAVAQTIGNLRLAEDDAKQAQDGVTEWGGKALAASRKADELRAAGNTAEADRFDDLAKVALKRQIGFEDQAKGLATQITAQTELTNRLKDGLNGMRAKREELVQKRNELVARAKMAEAQAKVQESLKSINATDPTSEVSRFEEKIRHDEAQVRGMEEVAASSLDAQFDSLEDMSADADVEARLAALKGGGTTPAS